MGFPSASVGVLGGLEAVVVDVVVAVVADQHEVRVVGGSVVSPELDVVGEAAVGGSATADAALVSDHEGYALGVGGGAACASEPQVLGLGIEYGGEDVGFEGQLDQFLHGQWGAVGEASVDQFPVGGVVVGHQY